MAPSARCYAAGSRYNGSGWCLETFAPSTIVAAAADTDSDGIPDWWESIYYGGATNANAAAMAANGQNTLWQAWVAHLNPTDPASVFKLLISTSAPPGTINLIINSTSPGRVY